MTDIKAKLNNFRSSPRKMRVVANLIKGKNVNEALAQLSFLTKRPASPVAKLLKSAISNAKNNFKITDDNSLVIKEIRVDCGPVLKRHRPRSRGMANQILKRTSHVSIILGVKPDNK